MKSIRAILLLVVLLSNMQGCIWSRGTIRTAGIKGVTLRVCATHDKYLASIASVDSETWLAESKAVRQLFESDEAAASTLGTRFAPVASRHDVWVRADEKISAVLRRVRLRNSALVRANLKEAGWEK